MIDLDEIRKVVAVKHDYLIGEDDPLLVMVTMQDEILRQSLEQLNARNDAHQKAVITLLQKTTAEAKLSAGRIITEGADYVNKQAKEAIASALDDAIARIRQRAEMAQQEQKTWVWTFSYGMLTGVLIAAIGVYLGWR